MKMTTANRHLQIPPLDAGELDREPLTLLLEGAIIELMNVLDYVEGNFDVNVAKELRFQPANKLIGLYILLRIGDRNIVQYLPELRRQTEEMRRLLSASIGDAPPG